MGQKLFVLIRKDLSVAQQGIQAGHAVAEWCKRWQFYGNQDWDNQTLVYVTVPNLEHLHIWMRKCTQNGLVGTGFKEPDINNEITAIACLTDGNLFDKLPLWDPVTDWVADSM